MSTRISAAVIVAGLLIAMSLLVTWTLWRQRDAGAADPALKIWAAAGWKIPAAILTLALAALVAILLAWTWQPRADFDVVGVLWALQNAPGLALLTMFGVLAIASFGIMIQALAAGHSGRQ